ncbi:hypothetical protein GRJ2_000884000 [Grus japonensis]|uniref:Endonuclease/exonuclease/phosphatase domain-containing protein n=1 Tax=Grus japonensis TaxID=30415 RepID=A0ABC9WGK8_GRUJA
MGNKWEEPEICVRSQCHDLIAITETWCDSLHDAVVDGKVLFRRDRPSRRGGGVALYVREQLECIKLRLGVDQEESKAYGPPDQEEEVDEAFCRQLEAASRLQALALMGDFNHPDICWKSNTAKRARSSRFLQGIDDNFLTQLVEEPTWREVLLDLVLTNKAGLVEDLKAGGSLGCSDHDMVEFRILRGRSRPVSRITTLDFRRANFGLFKDLLGRIPWVKVLEGKKEFDSMWKKGMATWEEYRNVVRVCSDATRKAKAQLELKVAGEVKDNEKGFFKYISSKRKTRENVGLLLNEVSALVMEDTEKAELLNAAFASVFTAKVGHQETQSLEAGEKVLQKEDVPLVEEDWVREHLGKLNIHQSMGPDGMHPRVLRELADVIARPLPIILERSWRTGEVPEDWRKANVTPVSKKGKKEDPGNYRASQPQLHPWEDDGATYSWGYQLARGGGEECYWEGSMWIDQGEIMPDQSDSLL